MKKVIYPIILVLALLPQTVWAHSTAPYFPSYTVKNLWETETATINNIVVTSDSRPLPGMEFVFYNTATQEKEFTVRSGSNGVIPEVKLKKDHNYMILCLDKDYFLKPVYVWVSNSQSKGSYELLDVKCCNGTNTPNCRFDTVTSLNLTRRKPYQQSDLYNRYFCRIPVRAADSAGGLLMKSLKFRLVSEYETLDVRTKNGYICVDLLEDIQYTVLLDDDEYDVELFPLTVKDHSERVDSKGNREGRNTYDHSSCAGVGEFFTVINGDPDPKYFLKVVRKGHAHDKDNTITSDTGKTTIGGMNFKDLITEERTTSTKVASLAAGTYETFKVITINTHRWEISKLCAGEFTVTEKLGRSAQVRNVYQLEKDGGLSPLAFTHDGNSITYSTDNLSIHETVVEYADAHNWNTGKVYKKPTCTKDGKMKYTCRDKKCKKTRYEVIEKLGHAETVIPEVLPTLYTAGKTEGLKCSRCKKTLVKQKTVSRLPIAAPEVAGGENAITVSSPEIDGSITYQIRYAGKLTSKGALSGAKTVTVKTGGELNKTIGKLKAGRTYYVQLRAKTRIGKKYYYTDWSMINEQTI